MATRKSQDGSPVSLKRLQEGPPLAPNTPVYPVYSTPVIRRETEKPCTAYLDVTFLDNQSRDMKVGEIEALLFKNHYTSSITISTLVGDSYVPILENKAIMTSPYYENGSQQWITIYVSEFNAHYVAGKPIRIFLYQPCPVWSEYEIRHICAVGQVRNAMPIVLVADGGVPMSSPDMEAVWRNRSLSSILKADTLFLLNKVAFANEKALKEASAKKSMLSDRNNKNNLSGGNSGKAKKEKKRTDEKKKKLVLAGGGMKKEVTVVDEGGNEMETDAADPDGL